MLDIYLHVIVCLVSVPPVNEPYGFFGLFDDIIFGAPAIFDDIYFVGALIESDAFSLPASAGAFEARLAFLCVDQCWEVFVLKHRSNHLWTFNPCWTVKGHAGIVQDLFGQLVLVLVSVGHRSQEWRSLVGEIAHSVDLDASNDGGNAVRVYTFCTPMFHQYQKVVGSNCSVGEWHSIGGYSGPSVSSAPLKCPPGIETTPGLVFKSHRTVGKITFPVAQMIRRPTDRHGGP